MKLEELRQNRLELVEALRKNNVGLKLLLTKLYPDEAHFIYELLQNAEDAGATKAKFTLRLDRVEFEHDGNRLFSVKDVDYITNVAYSAKKDDPTSIGKFGIGFKAVFAYTSTPVIESGEYHFRIHDMVVPDTEGLPPRTTDENGTRFILPFDNRDKPAEKAHTEIKKTLLQLNESTLLFLSNIKQVEYCLSDSTSGFMKLKETDENKIEISYLDPDLPKAVSINYLRFEKKVAVDDNGTPKTCHIAVAFRLKRIREQKQSGLQLTPQQWEIIPIEKDRASAGKVSIYFPAEKETSNLRFHLHAPFASTVERASIRESVENNVLRDHLADLIAESMIVIRDKKLLTTGFLATLPNDKDNLSEFYRPIQTRLVDAFNNKAITPMKNGKHAPAANIYRGSSQLSELISDKDLATILGGSSSPPLWVANPPQQNQRDDNFLNMLQISRWKTKDLIDKLPSNSDTVMRWLPKKALKWHQGLYVLLGDFLSEVPSYDQNYYKDKLLQLRVVLCHDRDYRRGAECYFPGDDTENDKHFPRVIKATYASGKNKNQQEQARKFLEDIGVCEVGEAQQVEAILKQRYAKDTIGPREQNHARDMERFIKLVEEDFSKTEIFKDYYIFKIDHEAWWNKPSEVFLDSPYLDTGLSAYYNDKVILVTPISRLYQKYEKYHIERERLTKFAKAVGAQTHLEVREQRISNKHPEYRSLVTKAPGQKTTRHSINEDYDIVGFKSLLGSLSIEKAKLIWRTMQDLPAQCLTARYLRSRSYEPCVGSSTLVHVLKKAEWVPQINDKQSSQCNFVKPTYAIAGNLPDGFSFKSGSEWLSAIEFGKEAEESTQERQNKKNAAKAFGFSTIDEAEDMATMLKENPKIIKDWKAKKQKPDFPESTSPNPGRREETVIAQVNDAPGKEYERKNRSVRTTKPSDQITYMRAKYINNNNEMVCQICKGVMPFKKRDGEYYFEAVEAFSNGYIPKEHEAQFLALCPLCAAMYKEFVKRDETAMRELHDTLKNSGELEVQLELGELKTSIRFVKPHFHDIKTILKMASP